MTSDQGSDQSFRHNCASIAVGNSTPDTWGDALAAATSAPHAPGQTIYCWRCDQPKTEADFYPSDLRNRSKRCKDCRNEIQRNRWLACKTLVDQLKDIDCPDCGLRWPPECMEFDHRDPAQKDVALSKIIASGSMSRLQRELIKGEFLCANCHRIRTGGFGYRRGLTGRAKAGEWLEVHQGQVSA